MEPTTNKKWPGLAFGWRDTPSPLVKPSPEEVTAFQEYAAEVSTWAGPALVLFLLGSVVLWWPVDLLVFAGQPRTITIFAQYRTVMAAMLLLIFLFFPRDVARRRPVVCYATLLVAGLSFSAWSLARVDGFDGPSFSYFYIGPLFCMPLMCSLRERIVVGTLISAGIILGFWAGAPTDTLANPDRSTLVSFFVFTSALAVALGHGVYLLACSGFVRARRAHESELVLSRKNALLADELADRATQLQRLASHLQRLREDERAWMSRELHDQLGQELTALRYAVALAQTQRAAGTAIDATLSQLEGLVADTHVTIRRLLQRLRPRVLDEAGLMAAARWLVDEVAGRTGLEITLSGTVDTPSSGSELETAAFRILQEALTNIERHASATQVQVTLQESGPNLRLEVADNGVGLPDEAIEGHAKGFGLLGIVERAAALGGEARFTRRPDAGTLVEVTLPLLAHPMDVAS